MCLFIIVSDKISKYIMFTISRLSRAVSKRLLLSHSYSSSSYYSSEYVFSQENHERTVFNFANLKPIRIHSKEPPRRAAVLIPLCEVDGKVALLYTLRAADLRAHRGQVSFPGGKKDDCDKTIEDTALREAVEELGIEAGCIEIWGSGKWMSTRTATSVVGVIGRIKNNLVIDNLRTNPSEVEEVFTVPLEELCDPNNLGYTQFRGKVILFPLSIPVFLGGKHKIWGITALMTHIFLKSLLPQEAYSHPIKYIPSVNICENLSV